MSRRKQGRPRHLETEPDLSEILEHGDESPTENGDAHVCGKCREEFLELSDFIAHKKQCSNKRIVVTYAGGQGSEKDQEEEDEEEEQEDDLVSSHTALPDVDASIDNNNSSVTKDLNTDIVQEDKSSLHSEKSDADSGLTNGDMDAMDAESHWSDATTAPSPAPTLTPTPGAAPSFPQLPLDLASLLPNSNVMLETLMNTKVAVAQFAENNLSPHDITQMQNTLYSLQQQQLMQLQLIEQLQQQLFSGMGATVLPPGGVMPNLPAVHLQQSHLHQLSQMNQKMNALLPGPHHPHHHQHPPSSASLHDSLPVSSSVTPVSSSGSNNQASGQTTTSTSTSSTSAAVTAKHTDSTVSTLSQPNLKSSTSPKQTPSKSHLVTNSQQQQPTVDSGKGKSVEAKATSLERSQYAAEDPFFKHKCRFCHKVFGSDSALQIHIRSHTGERPYKCNVCGNRFTTRGNLKVHFSRHKLRYPHLKMNPNPFPEHLDKPAISRHHHHHHPHHLPPHHMIKPPRHIPPPLNGPPPLQKTAPMLLPDSAIPLKMEPPVLSSEPLNASTQQQSNNAINNDTNQTTPPQQPLPAPQPQEDLPKSITPSHDDASSDRTKTEEEETPKVTANEDDNEMADDASDSDNSSLGEHSESPHESKTDDDRKENSTPPVASTVTTFSTATTPSVMIPGMFGAFPPPPLPPFGMEVSPYYRPSILPQKDDDSMEEFMEVSKSETSKLQQLVENIEQKLSDPNECAICHRILSCKSALQMHYRVHTGERPFKCKICGRAFTTKGNLKTHMGVHRSKPPVRMLHQCPVCHKQFTNALVLQQHIRQHTADIPLDMKSHLMPPGMEFMPGMPPHLPGFPFMPPHPMPAELDLRKPVNKDDESAKFGKDKDDVHRKSVDSKDGGASENGPMNMSSSRHEQLSPDSMDSESHHQQTQSHDGDIDKEDDDIDDDDMLGDDDDDFDDNTSEKMDENDAEDDMKSMTSSDRMTPASVGNNIHASSPYMFGAPMMTMPLGVPGPFPPASMVDMASNFFGQPSVITSGFNPNSSTSLMALEERVKSITSMAPSGDMSRPLEQMANLLQRANFHPAMHPHVAPRIPGENGIPGFPAPEVQNPNKKDTPKTGSSVSPYLSSSDSNASFDSNTHTTDSINNERATPSDLLPPPFRGLGALDLSNASASKLSTTCNVCYKTFACKSALDIHYRSHTKERPYQCEVCDRSFTTRGNMKQHMLTHKIRDLPSQAFENQTSSSSESASANQSGAETGDKSSEPVLKKIKTEIASPESKTKESPPSSDLLPFTPLTSTSSTANKPVSPTLPTQGHPQSSHPPPPPQHSNDDSLSPFTKRNNKHLCVLCQKNFSSASALQIHNRTHTGDKPFKCNVCGKAFTTKGNLKVHMGTHMWNNSPSRRGRRMSVDIPGMINPKDAEFFANLAQRGSSDLYPFQYPPFSNGMTPKMNEISVITSLNNGLNPMLMNGTAPSIHKPPHFPSANLPEALLKNHKSPTSLPSNILKPPRSPLRSNESLMKSPENSDLVNKNGLSPNNALHSPARKPLPSNESETPLYKSPTTTKPMNSPHKSSSQPSELSISMPETLPMMSPPTSMNIHKDLNSAPIGSNGELDLSAKRIMSPPVSSFSSSYESKVMSSGQLSPTWAWKNTCHLCSKVCNSQSSLELHMKSHLPRPQSSPKPLMA